MYLSKTRSVLVLLCSVALSSLQAQPIHEKLAAAFSRFAADPQLQNALISLYVENAATGSVVFDRNSKVGVAPASTQKIITSVSAYELLGKEYRYRTAFGYTGKLINGVISGNFLIKPSGDPTLGSWRWKATSEASVLDRVAAAFLKSKITAFGPTLINARGWKEETIPDGWIWQDIGNYYGAGAAALNWRENQYDILLRSRSEVGTPVSIAGTVPAHILPAVESMATAAGKGSGDQAYVYYTNFSRKAIVRGTIPINENSFVISAALPNAADEVTSALLDILAKKAGVVPMKFDGSAEGETIIHTEISPPLDSIIYWFNKKSINLYGEALIKTIGFEQARRGSTAVGVDQIKAFWKIRGLEPGELNIVDGSGLSPLNRVTTRAQVRILQYAQKQAWFNSFYHSLPEYNGMKLKSGTISGVKGFCGYHTAQDGKRYVLSFIVNNYSGSASALVQKMYALLNLLK
ncbi:MAG: D-alanyl-D-alanine carboxypeptidase/D-alanyl-D-alanine-endopeptidase [Chitinophagaceae bacterium]